MLKAPDPAEAPPLSQAGGTPLVWLLLDDRPGNNTQTLGLARALGWPTTTRRLRYGRLAGLHNLLLGASLAGLDRQAPDPLAPPWPDLVIATGRRTAPVARWIRREGRGRTRAVQLGRKGTQRAGDFDLVISPAHCRLPAHPRRLVTAAPLTRIDQGLLDEALAAGGDPFGEATGPRIALLVGGATARFRLDRKDALGLGAEARALAEAEGGRVLAVCSRRTGRIAETALAEALGPAGRVAGWQPDNADNIYLRVLARADILAVTGDSESMLAEAVAAAAARPMRPVRPVLILPLPERPPGLILRLGERLARRALANPRGLAARLVSSGLVRPPRDMATMHRTLVDRGLARLAGGDAATPDDGAPDDMAAATSRVRAMMAAPDPGRPSGG